LFTPGEKAFAKRRRSSNLKKKKTRDQGKDHQECVLRRKWGLRGRTRGKRAYIYRGQRDEKDKKRGSSKPLI